jgi:hypothetical protein
LTFIAPHLLPHGIIVVPVIAGEDGEERRMSSVTPPSNSSNGSKASETDEDQTIEYPGLGRLVSTLRFVKPTAPSAQELEYREYRRCCHKDEKKGYCNGDGNRYPMIQGPQKVKDSDEK